MYALCLCIIFTLALSLTHRSLTLSRTRPSQALRILARLENPCPPGLSRRQYDAWVDSLVSTKFQYVVSSQVGI